MSISVRRTRRGVPVDTRRLKAFLRCVLLRLGREGADLSVLLAGDRRVRELNRRFRGVDRPTDVLSFPREGTPGQSDLPPPLGDVIVSLDRAREQAADAGRSLDDELEVLLVHGVLHLAGFAHEEGGEPERRMRRRQGDLLRRCRP